MIELLRSAQKTNRKLRDALDESCRDVDNLFFVEDTVLLEEAADAPRHTISQYLKREDVHKELCSRKANRQLTWLHLPANNVSGAIESFAGFCADQAQSLPDVMDRGT